jgi:hypothetical protein
VERQDSTACAAWSSRLRMQRQTPHARPGPARGQRAAGGLQLQCGDVGEQGEHSAWPCQRARCMRAVRARARTSGCFAAARERAASAPGAPRWSPAARARAARLRQQQDAEPEPCARTLMSLIHGEQRCARPFAAAARPGCSAWQHEGAKRTLKSGMSRLPSVRAGLWKPMPDRIILRHT